MHRHWTAMIALLFAMMLAGAYPNFNAATGIVAVPTAHTLGAGELVAAADALFLEDTTFTGRVMYGLTEQVEIGAGSVMDTDTAFGVNIKYQLPVTAGGLTWAAGAAFITSDVYGTEQQVYLAGTRPLTAIRPNGAGLWGTIGINFTDIEGLGGMRPFVGAQLRIGADTEIAGELVLASGDFEESISSLAVRQRLNERLTGQVGFTNAAGFAGGEDHDLFIGVAYAFDE